VDWCIIQIDFGAVSSDDLKLGLYQGRAGSKTLAYGNAGTLTTGDFAVSPATGRPSAIVGSGTLASISGNGLATITFDVTFGGSTWSGTVVVSDPGVGFSATIPIHAGPAEVWRSGTKTGGTLWSFKPLTVPQKCFKIVFAIDDLG